MAGREITIELDRPSEAALEAVAKQEGVSAEYAASMIVARHLNKFSQGFLAPSRPSEGRAVESE